MTNLNRRTFLGQTVQGVALLAGLSSCVPQAERFDQRLLAPLPPRLRGVQLDGGEDWNAVQPGRWLRLSELVDWGVNVLRIELSAVGVHNKPAPPKTATLTERVLEDLETRWSRVITWALANQMHVVLVIQPYTWRTWPEKGSLWQDERLQDELVAAWEALTARFQGEPGVIFDLFNEPHAYTVEETQALAAMPGQVWNRLTRHLIGAIHAVDSQRRVMIEPIWAVPSNLVELTLLRDPRVMCSVHFYFPLAFTAQGALLNRAASAPVTYPGFFANDQGQTPQRWDREALKRQLQPVLEFQRSTGARIFVGEFGCWRAAPPQSRADWVIDAVSLFEEFGFDYTYFVYNAGQLNTDPRTGWMLEDSGVEPILKRTFALNAP
jgi:Cellulase (glycosyl hydrolase family 5)